MTSRSSVPKPWTVRVDQRYLPIRNCRVRLQRDQQFRRRIKID
jgi:hypothetical protein